LVFRFLEDESNFGISRTDFSQVFTISGSSISIKNLNLSSNSKVNSIDKKKLTRIYSIINIDILYHFF
jgi:hypothetical protein